MYIFNTTFIVAQSSEVNWLNFIASTYIIELRKNFEQHQYTLSEVMIESPDDSKSFSLQWRLKNREELENFKQLTDDLHQIITEQFGQNCLYFSSTLQLIDI